VKREYGGRGSETRFIGILVSGEQLLKTPKKEKVLVPLQPSRERDQGRDETRPELRSKESLSSVVTRGYWHVEKRGVGGP